MTARPKIETIAPIAILLVHLCLGTLGVLSLSSTYDEDNHIAIGYSTLITGKYCEFLGHPPFARFWASLPLLFLRPNTMIDSLAYQQNSLYEYGNQFIYSNNVPFELMLNVPRLFMFWTLSPLLALGIFLWSKELFGLKGEVGSLFLYAFCPVILANAPLVTTDFALTVFSFWFLYALYKCQRSWRSENHSMRWPMLAGLFLGLSLASKFSAILLLGILSLYVMINLAIKKGGSSYIKLFLQLCAGGLVATFVVLLNYQFTQIPLFFDGLKMAFLTIGQGIGRISYFMGDTSATGWRTYFIMLFLLKTPISLMILFAVGIYSWLRNEIKTSTTGNGYIKNEEIRDMLIFLVAPIALWMGVASYSKLQIGIRHILPIFPLIIVFAGQGIKRLAISTSLFKKAVLTLLGVWYIASTIKIHPNYLAYFNEFAGGPSNGIRFFSDSNLDWGQGLKSLSRYLKSRGNPPIYLCYFGNADPHAYDIRYVPVGMFSEVLRNGDKEKVFLKKPTLFAISATNRVATFYIDRTLMKFLDPLSPVAVVAHSIYVYDVTNRPDTLAHIAHIMKLENRVDPAQELTQWLNFQRLDKNSSKGS